MGGKEAQDRTVGFRTGGKETTAKARVGGASHRRLKASLRRHDALETRQDVSRDGMLLTAAQAKNNRGRGGPGAAGRDSRQ